MGILSPEAAERLGAIIDGAAPAPGTEEARLEGSTPADLSQNEIEVPDSSSDSAPDVNISAKEEAPDASVPADEAEIEVEDGHRVPYSRFRQVLDARNKHRDELEAMRSKMADVEQEREMLQRLTIQRATEPQVQQKADDDWLGETTGDGEGSSAPDPRLANMASRLDATEKAFQRMKLDAEVADAMKTYPTADRAAIIDAIYNQPSLSAMSAAEQYSTWLAGIEEAAIARHFADSGQAGEAAPVEAKPQAAPRPQKAGAGSVGDFVGEKKPKTVKEGSAMFRDFLKEHNPFV